MNSPVWFSPAPNHRTNERIRLDFGLRKADLFFRELVVPGLGRVWFVRQLSWPLAALAIHVELKKQGKNAPKPTAICHGIEALACKLQYKFEPQSDGPEKAKSFRILGRRAFGRDAELKTWSFDQLHRASNYVRNTHRQSATRALRVDGGLGFVSGPRFDLLQLEPIGVDLANTFLEQKVGRSTLRKCLCGWLSGKYEIPKEPKVLHEVLSPEHTTQAEFECVKSRLLDTSTEESNKRLNLKNAMQTYKQAEPNIEKIVEYLQQVKKGEQVKEIVAALAFGAMLDRARDALAALTCLVEPARGGIPLDDVAKNKTVNETVADLKNVAESFLVKSKDARVEEKTSLEFAKAIKNANDKKVIEFLVQRAGGVLGISGDSIIRGNLFRLIKTADDADDIDEGADSIEPDRTGRTFRIANLHSLLQDIKLGEK
jgi:hypothetical protein